MYKMTEMDKEYLTRQVIAYQNGNEEAFGQIYSLMSDMLFRYAMVMTKNRTEAEDLLQDTMVEIVKSVGNLREPAAFMKWSFQIMRNVYMHKLRKSKAVLARDEEDLEIIENTEDDDWSYRPDTAVDIAGTGDIVREMINMLPEAQRTAMVAFYYDGLSVREIAEMMDASENTTKSRLFAGRKAMKRGIEDYEQRTGVRLHEFTPASVIIGAMRQLFASAEFTLGAALQSIFRRVIEATGLALAKLSVPEPVNAPQQATPHSAPQAPQSTPQPSTEPAPQQAPQSTPQPSTEPAPQQAPQSTPQPSAEPAPQQAPQSTPQPSAEPAPQSGTQPTPQSAPQSAPQQTPVRPAPQQAPQPAPQSVPHTTPAPQPSVQPSTVQTPVQPDTFTAPSETSVPHVTDSVPRSADSISHGSDTVPRAEKAADKMPDKAAEKAKDLEKRKARKAKNDDLNEINEKRAKVEPRQKNIKQEMRASRLKLLGKAALTHKIIAGILAVGILGGAGTAVVRHLVGGARAEKVMSDYSKAYLSVLYMYENDIREYDWQYYLDYPYKFGYTDTPVSQVEGAPDYTARPAALKDVDGDGIPELFIMTSVVSPGGETLWYSADLHIYTFKDGELRELRYEMEYPGEYSADSFEQRMGYYVSHDERMVHFNTGEPNTTYMVFTGKEKGSLYILATNLGSEESELRMRKYSMESDAESSWLSMLSETFLTDALGGIFTSDDPSAEMKVAFEDMDDMVLYGGEGYEGAVDYTTYVNGRNLPDAKKNGWHAYEYYFGNVIIAPEHFQSCLSMTYDEIVALLLGQVIEEENDDAYAASPDGYVPLKYGENVQPVGGTLFRNDYDAGKLWFGSIGSAMDESIDLNAVAGIGRIFTDGKSLLYLSDSDPEVWGSSMYLKQYDLTSGKEELIHIFEGVDDPNASHYIGAVYDGKAYIGFTAGDVILACDLESGDVTDLNEHGYIQEQSGKYVVLMERSTLSALDVMPADIYELTGDGMKHVANLGSRVTVSTDIIDGKLYYSLFTDDTLQALELHRCNVDGSDDEQIAVFHPDDGYNALVEKYAPTYCIVRFGIHTYKYDYETERGTPLD